MFQAAAVRTLWSNFRHGLSHTLHVHSNHVYSTKNIKKNWTLVQKSSPGIRTIFEAAFVPVCQTPSVYEDHKTNRILTVNLARVESPTIETGLVLGTKDPIPGRSDLLKWSGSMTLNKALNAFIKRKFESINRRETCSFNECSEIQHVVLTGWQSIKYESKFSVNSAISGRLRTVTTSGQKVAMFSTTAKSEPECGSHITFPSLKYKYEDLEPNISSTIMEDHHKLHHKGYVINYNKLIDRLRIENAKDYIATVQNVLPALRFNYNAHINHSLFWDTISPHSSKPSDELNNAIIENFGEWNTFMQQITEGSGALQGSGWYWLGIHPFEKKLKLIDTKNQDQLWYSTGLIPLMGIDLWEHAYYTQYKNQRGIYIEKVLEIINWETVSKRFTEASNYQILIIFADFYELLESFIKVLNVTYERKLFMDF